MKNIFLIIVIALLAAFLLDYFLFNQTELMNSLGTNVIAPQFIIVDVIPYLLAIIPSLFLKILLYKKQKIQLNLFVVYLAAALGVIIDIVLEKYLHDFFVSESSYNHYGIYAAFFLTSLFFYKQNKDEKENKSIELDNIMNNDQQRKVDETVNVNPSRPNAFQNKYFKLYYEITYGISLAILVTAFKVIYVFTNKY